MKRYNDTNVGLGMVYDTPEEKEILALTAKNKLQQNALQDALEEQRRLRAELGTLENARQEELKRLQNAVDAMSTRILGLEDKLRRLLDTIEGEGTVTLQTIKECRYILSVGVK